MNDFNEALATVARVFLLKHMDQYLADDQRLLELCSAHLVTMFNLDESKASQITAREFLPLRRDVTEVFADISSSTSSTVVLVDPRSGQAVAIPVAELARLYFKSG